MSGPEPFTEQQTPACSAPNSTVVLPARLLTNVFIAALLIAMLAEGTPRLGAPHRWFAKQVQWVVNPLGIYQTRWQLFAPAPVDANCWITAKVVLADGHCVNVRTPDWRSMTVLQRFLHSRHKKYVFHLQKRITKDKLDPLWPCYADYLARTSVRDGGQRVARVELTCHSYPVDPPATAWIPFGGVSAKVDSTEFYAKDYP